MDVLDDGEVVIQHLMEAKTGSKRIVDVFRVSSDGQKVESLCHIHTIVDCFSLNRSFTTDRIEGSTIHISRVKVHFHCPLTTNNTRSIRYQNNSIINIVEHGSL